MMQYYTLSQAAALVGVSYGRLYWVLRTHQLRPSIQAGRTRLFTERDLPYVRQFFTKRTRGPDRAQRQVSATLPRPRQPSRNGGAPCQPSPLAWAATPTFPLSGDTLARPGSGSC